jgi:hypothetical protein
MVDLDGMTCHFSLQQKECHRSVWLISVPVNLFPGLRLMIGRDEDVLLGQ